jgi:predicted nucleotidyltransferase
LRLGLVANWESAGMRTSGIETYQPPSIDAPVLAEIVRRLAEAYRPERIYLFGSTARGDAGPDSDYDLMIIIREDAPLQLRSEDLAYRALRGTGTAADVLVWSRDDFDRQLHLKASLPSTVIREGKLLYGAG